VIRKKTEQFIDEDKCEWESYEQYVWSGVLDLCGCYSESLFDLTFEILGKLYEAKITKDGSYFYDYKEQSQHYTDLQELILHNLSRANLTEHGCSVRGGWLTDKGFKLCEMIYEKKE